MLQNALDSFFLIYNEVKLINSKEEIRNVIKERQHDQ